MTRATRVLVAVCVLLASCGEGAALPFAEPGPLQVGFEEYEAVASAEMAIYESGDFEAERDLYVEDIVIVDGDGSAEGIDELIWIAKFVATQFPDYTMEHTATYAGFEDGIVVMDQWGWEGFTEDDRVHEYRIIEVEDGVITAWEAIYNMDGRPYFGDRGGADEAALALLDRYLAAWASGEVEEVESVYAADAVRLDPLMVEEAAGREAIGELASGYFERLPGMTFESLETIGLRSHVREDIGVMVSITWDSEPGCSVQAVLWLEGADGLVERERVYYDVPSLVACGWLGAP